METIYCLRCKKHQKANNITRTQSTYKDRLVGTCATCGGQVSRFVAPIKNGAQKGGSFADIAKSIFTAGDKLLNIGVTPGGKVFEPTDKNPVEPSLKIIDKKGRVIKL